MSPKVDENRYYLVTGKIQNVEEYYFCSTARSIESLCGPIGKKYEKK